MSLSKGKELLKSLGASVWKQAQGFLSKAEHTVSWNELRDPQKMLDETGVRGRA